MIPQDRDKVRIHALLTAKRGEAFSVEELAKVTGLPTSRILAAGSALVTAGLAKSEENYFWTQSYREAGKTK